MKILAQSTVPVRPSYVHLGYLASGTTFTSRPYGGVAIGLIILGALAMSKLKTLQNTGVRGYCFCLRSRPTRLVGLVVVLLGVVLWWRRPQPPDVGLAFVVVLAGLLGVVKLKRLADRDLKGHRIGLRSGPMCWVGLIVVLAGTLLWWFGPQNNRRVPIAYTHLVLKYEVPAAIDRECYHDHLASLDDEQLAKRLAVCEDGWYHRLRIRRMSQQPARYQIRSAGPDGLFDTSDDLVNDFEPRVFESASQPA